MNIQKHKAEDYPYIFRSSVFYLVFMKAVSLFFILFIYYFFTHYLFELNTIFIKYSVLIIAVLYTIYSVISYKNNSIIKLNSKGIWTLDTGFVNWDKIKNIVTIHPKNKINKITL